MGINNAFDALQRAVDADPAQVQLARSRRDTFKKALGAEADVVEVFGSGSLRRSTQLKPIHDVDLVVVYAQGDHPGWGLPGNSAEEALNYTRERVNDLLGATYGSVDQLVRLALRQADGTLLIPEALSHTWVTADPEDLIRRVAARQADWSYFRPIVRVLKDWRRSLKVESEIKSLLVEVLALECMPRSGRRPEALRAFFTAAAVRVNTPIEDPAGHCGLIQPNLDKIGLRTALEVASEIATRACAHAATGNTDDAVRAWQEIFGEAFPAPAKKKVSPAVTGPALILPRPIKDAPQG